MYIDMSVVNQNVRYAQSGGVNNPLAILDAYKPTRFLFEARIPNDNEGESFWCFIDTSTGNMYIKESGTWVFKYTFGTGGGGGTISGATNVGGFAEWFKEVVGTDLTFRTIHSSDSSVVITQQSDAIDITVPAVSGFLTDVASVGTGVSVYRDQVGTTANLRSLVSSDDSLSVTLNGDLIDIKNNTASDITAVQNVGSGAQLVAGTTAGVVSIRTLTSSTGKVVFTPQPSVVDCTLLINKDDVGLNFVENRAEGHQPFSPNITADSNSGYFKGTLWSQYGSSGRIYMCLDDTPGAAVWVLVADSSVNPDPVYKKDCISAHIASPYTQAIVTSSTAVVGITWALITSQGSWNLNSTSGIGPYAIRRVVAADAETDNYFNISISADFTAATTIVREVDLIMYVNGITVPISGSGGRIVLVPEGGVAKVGYSRTFQYKAGTFTGINFYLGIRYPNHSPEGNFNLTFEDITVSFAQQ